MTVGSHNCGLWFEQDGCVATPSLHITSYKTYSYRSHINVHDLWPCKFVGGKMINTLRLRAVLIFQTLILRMCGHSIITYYILQDIFIPFSYKCA